MMDLNPFMVESALTLLLFHICLQQKFATIPTAYNKEEKRERVLNVLYALRKMFSESHAPGIKH